jgi:hypothetical protein
MRRSSLAEKQMRHSLGLLENLLKDFLNGKITKEQLQHQYQNYCDIRDM